MDQDKTRRRRGRPRLRPRTHKPAGTPPGTLIPEPEALPSVVRVLAYGPDGHEESQIDDPREVEELLGRWPVTWVNVDGLADASVLAEFGRIFDLHPLALEDVLHTRQRPKIEEYAAHLFIVSRMPSPEDSELTEQLAIFLGPGFVLTFQERPGDCLDPVRNRIRNGRGQIRDAGPDYLTYSLLDTVIDSFFPILEGYGERLEELEDQVITEPTTETIERVYQTKRELLGLRRAIWPQRDMLNSLLRDPSELVTDGTRVYLRDAYDHNIGLIDLLETYRELGSSLTDLYLSSASNRMNEIMKVLTLIATVFIPLTFVVGVYGMNFNTHISPWNMPELDWRWGYPVVMLVMALIAGALVLYFRRRRWV